MRAKRRRTMYTRIGHQDRMYGKVVITIGLMRLVRPEEDEPFAVMLRRRVMYG